MVRSVSFASFCRDLQKHCMASEMLDNSFTLSFSSLNPGSIPPARNLSHGPSALQISYFCFPLFQLCSPAKIPESCPGGWTPLHIAALLNKKDVIKADCAIRDSRSQDFGGDFQKPGVLLVGSWRNPATTGRQGL